MRALVLQAVRGAHRSGLTGRPLGLKYLWPNFEIPELN